MEPPEKDIETEAKNRTSDTKKITDLLNTQEIGQSREIHDVDYGTFDTFLFYSFFVIKKWMFIFPLYLDYLNINKIKALISSAIQTFQSKEFSTTKRVLTIIALIPIGIILLIYGSMLVILIVLLVIVGYFCLIFFIDLPFWITVSIQSVLLYLLICFPLEVGKEELSSAFLTALWWIQLIWILLFTLVMLQEIDDAMNSVIFIWSFYKNRKLKKSLYRIYSTVSCMPQMVQLLITFICASYASDLIFNNVDYLTPFLHFGGLFVILKIDSFIMTVVRGSLFYVPPVNSFKLMEISEEAERVSKGSFVQESVGIEPKKKETEIEATDNFNDQENRELELKVEIKPFVQEKTHPWYKIHFPSAFIMKVLDIKIAISSVFYNLKPQNPDLDDLVKLKYFIMGIGIFIVFAHLLKNFLQLTCNCSYD